MEELTTLAAGQEADTAKWQKRFAFLYRESVLRLPAGAGTSFALATNAAMNDWPVPAILRWLQRAVAGPLQAGARVIIDVSALDTGGATAWRRAFRGFQTDAAEWPGRLACSLFLRDTECLSRFAGLGVDVMVRYAHDDHALLQALASRSYSDARVRPVPVAGSRALSGLHSAEKGQAVMPGGLFEVPANSAWLLIDIDMRRLGVASDGRRVLSDCLRFADNLIDVLPWPSPALRLDALLNRRVALRLTHVGDVLSSAGCRPGDRRSFDWLHRRLQFLRAVIVHESMLLARQRGPFPELCADDLVTSLAPRYGVGEARRLLRNRMLRHRHLLTLSPLHLIPHRSDGDAGAWTDLIPAIACADTIGMGGPDGRAGMSAADWHRLLRLTAAVAAGGVRGSRVRRYSP